MTHSAALTVSNLHFRVRGLKIIDGVSFEVQQGQILGIIGPNGSGKTTLFNCISGFNQVRQGHITLIGKDITTLSPSQRAHCGLGRVFQNSGVFREMSLLENLVTALEARQSILKNFFPWSAQCRENRAQARSLLSEVGLENKLFDKASSLSGGQLRLLEIIRAYAFGAEVFLLDEPTAGVSPRMKDDVVGLILRLKEKGKTILVIEHDITFIQRFCDRIVVLNLGQVVMDDTPAKVRENPQLQEIYFGTIG